MASGSSLTLENVKSHDRQSLVLKQFRCSVEKCGRVFWRRVDETKPWAGCRICKRKWKKGGRRGQMPKRLVALPRECMIGYAKFECVPCSNIFTNLRAMYEVEQPCRKCREGLLPCTELRPPPRWITAARSTASSMAGSRESLVSKDEKKKSPTSPSSATPSTESDAAASLQRLSLAGIVPPGYQPYRQGTTGGPPEQRKERVRLPQSRKVRKHVHECALCDSGGCRIDRVQYSDQHEPCGDTTATMATELLDTGIGMVWGEDGWLDEERRYEVILTSKEVTEDPSNAFECFWYGDAQGGGERPPTIEEDGDNN